MDDETQPRPFSRVDVEKPTIVRPGVMPVEPARQTWPAQLEVAEYKRIFDAAPARLLLLMPDENFTILDATDAYLRATHAQRDAILGRGLFEVFPDRTASLRASLLRVLARRAPDTVALQAQSGAEERHWSAVSSPVLSEDGQMLWILHLVQDITERVEAEANRRAIDEQRQRAEDTLRESERRKDELIATLSHELRNPLAPLRNGLNLLRLTARADAGAAAVHRMMERQVNQLVRLLDDLLEMSRITRGVLELRRERVELASVIRDAVETSEPLIRDAGHQLEVKLPRQLLWLEGDPVRLAQILANLLNNAARFTESGGRITLSAEARDGAAVVSVRDTGVGFAPGAGERLFEMFTRSDRSRGLGLGLALARRLAQMHGGTIEARSAGEGLGAEFIVRLPLAPAQPQAAEGEGRGETEAPIGCRVLIADDNRDAADSLAELMRDMGADVFLAYDGEQAVEMARAFRPDVALLDIGMPKLDGYQAAQRIRSDAGDRPPKLIALTGWSQDEDRRRARDAGFDEHLVKPAELDKLRRLLVSSTQQKAAANGAVPRTEPPSSGSGPRVSASGASAQTEQSSASDSPAMPAAEHIPSAASR